MIALAVFAGAGFLVAVAVPVAGAWLLIRPRFPQRDEPDLPPHVQIRTGQTTPGTGAL